HEGHGEMPTEPAKYGGVLGNVVSETKFQKKEKGNPILLKAELVRSADGTVRLYLYDLDMKELKVSDFSEEARGIVENERAKTEQKFSLKSHRDHYLGKMPLQKKRPFNVYLHFSKGEQKY